MKRRERINSSVLRGSCSSMSSALRGMPSAAPFGYAAPSDSSDGSITLNVKEYLSGSWPSVRPVMIATSHERPAVPHRILPQAIAWQEGVEPPRLNHGQSHLRIGPRSPV